MSRYYRTILNVQATALDPDAQAFLTAAGIVDATITSAINNLVVGLKSAGLWAKMKAIYPFVGGTATTHKFNLKDPRDLDAAFRITWFGGVTHSANGVQGNGTNGYGNTHIIASTHLQLNNAHGSFYSRTDVNGGSDFGSQFLIGDFRYFYLAIRNGGNLFGLVNQNGVTSVSNANSLGNYLINRTASNVKNIFKDGSKVENVTTASINTSTRPIYLLAFNQVGVAADFSNRQCAFASFGEGLTDTEATNFNTVVHSFQTTLGRNV